MKELSARRQPVDFKSIIFPCQIKESTSNHELTIITINLDMVFYGKDRNSKEKSCTVRILLLRNLYNASGGEHKLHEENHFW